jgi:Zn-dependent M28 family amino/carboxypeptidase
MRAPRRPERTIVFFSPTAEEAGLLGSAYYAEHPVVPLASSVAALNMDTLHFGGPRRDVSVVGWKASELQDLLGAAARRQGRVLVPEPTPQDGMYFRSDHFNFAKAGVPALYFKLGVDDRERGPAWGQAQRDEYYATRYHKSADRHVPGTDLRGGLEDLQLMYAVGDWLANSRRFPGWSPESEFRAVRERSLAEARDAARR